MTSQVFDSLMSQLKRHEGVMKKVYKDSMGIETIGVGRNLRDVGLEDDEISILLINDMNKAEKAVRDNIPWTSKLDGNRFAVLVNMCFNMGIGGLLQFTNTLAHIQSGDYDGASKMMLESLWAAQVGPRAKELSEQMRTGAFMSQE